MTGRRAEEFARYYERVRERTRRVAALIPPERLEWSYRPGKFSFGDVLRHLAALERYMWAENARLRPAAYPGHGRELAEGYDATMAFFERLHAESMAIFRSLSDDDLQRKCLTPAGHSVTVWKWLRAMVEHEVHHRGQLYVYLGLLGAATPALYGLTSEEVRRASRDAPEGET